MTQATLWITLALLLVTLLALIGLRRRRARPSFAELPADWPLNARSVFSADERQVYRQLRAALPQHIVLAKLPLVRFCQPPRQGDVRYWFQLLGAIHVTFAICNEAGDVLAVVDLESRRGSSRRAQDIKDAVVAACNVRYLRCAPGEVPSLPELRGLVPPLVEPAPVLPVSQTSAKPSNTVAHRRQERANRWADSTASDSTFDELGGIVEDPPSPALRH